MKKNKCSCVYATSENSEGVRKGYEVGGYLKHECDECKRQAMEDERFAGARTRQTYSGVVDTTPANSYLRQDRRKNKRECSCADLEAEVKRIATALEGLERIVRHTVTKGVP